MAENLFMGKENRKMKKSAFLRAKWLALNVEGSYFDVCSNSDLETGKE